MKTMKGLVGHVMVYWHYTNMKILRSIASEVVEWRFWRSFLTLRVHRYYYVHSTVGVLTHINSLNPYKKVDIIITTTFYRWETKPNRSKIFSSYTISNGSIWLNTLNIKLYKMFLWSMFLYASISLTAIPPLVIQSIRDSKKCPK